MIKSDIHLSMHNAYALVRVENWFSNHRSNKLAISSNVNSLWFLSSLPDASGKSLLRKLGFGYMLSLMVAYTSRIIMQAIPTRVIGRGQGDQVRIDHGHSRQPLGERYGPVGYRIYREVVSCRGGETRSLPMKGKVHRCEASSLGP